MMPQSFRQSGAKPLEIDSSLSQSASENVGQASSLTVTEASLPRVSDGRMPPEPADKMSAPHFLTASQTFVDRFLTAIGTGSEVFWQPPDFRSSSAGCLPGCCVQ